MAYGNHHPDYWVPSDPDGISVAQSQAYAMWAIAAELHEMNEKLD